MKNIYLVIVCLAMALGLQAATTARDLFVAAPRTVLPLLERNQRLDMLDYYDAGLTNTTKNALDGGSRVVTLEPGRIVISMTDASTLEIDILPAGKQNIYAVISTVNTPAANSTIVFYDEAWGKLDSQKLFVVPQISDWITDKSHEADVTMLTPFIMAGYTYTPASKTLTAKNNSDVFLGKDMFSQIAEWMRPQITYLWDGKQFKKQ